MQTTITRTTPDGVVVRELATGAAPVPPSPPPPPPRSAPVIDVPEGEPRAVALAVLGMLIGDEAAASFRGRAAAAQADIEAHVENARLHVDVKIESFVAYVAQKIRIRNELTARADSLQKRPGVPPLDLATELCSYVRSVKRWEDGNAIRADRAVRIGLAAQELAEITTKLRTGLPQSVRSHHTSDVNEGHHARGFAASEDAWLRHYESALIRRAELRRVLDRLGRGRAETGKAAADAVAMLGAAKVAGVIAPRMVVDGQRVKELGATLFRLNGELGAIDARTQAWRELDGRRKKAEGELAAAERAVEQARADAAALVMARAISGDLGDVLALEKLVGSIPALAAALGMARGNDDELRASVGLMIEAADARVAAEIAWKQGLNPPKHYPGGGDYAGGGVAAIHEAQQAEHFAYVEDSQAAARAREQRA